MTQFANSEPSLQGKKIAILVADGFEQVELTEPRKALDAAGAQTRIVSPAEGWVKGWQMKEWGDALPVDVPLAGADADEFDALLLPGGVMNPDKLRMNPAAVAFVKAFVAEGKPVAAICHGPWTLVEAGAVRGKTLTSWPSLQTDIRNAGGRWVDQQVVSDAGLVTSRKPDDIPAFNEKMIRVFAGGSAAWNEPAWDEHTGRSGARPEERTSLTNNAADLSTSETMSRNR